MKANDVSYITLASDCVLILERIIYCWWQSCKSYSLFCLQVVHIFMTLSAAANLNDCFVFPALRCHFYPTLTHYCAVFTPGISASSQPGCMKCYTLVSVSPPTTRTWKQPSWFMTKRSSGLWGPSCTKPASCLSGNCQICHTLTLH